MGRSDGRSEGAKGEWGMCLDTSGDCGFDANHVQPPGLAVRCNSQKVRRSLNGPGLSFAELD